LKGFSNSKSPNPKPENLNPYILNPKPYPNPEKNCKKTKPSALNPTLTLTVKSKTLNPEP
jgi:hypothetical protein